MKTLWIAVLLLHLFNACLTEWFEREGELLIVFNATITNDSDGVRKLEAYSNESFMSFFHSVLPEMSREMLQHLTSHVRFACSQGVLPTFSILPKHESFWSMTCGTTAVVINPQAANYQMKELILVEAPLKALPRHLNMLKKLQYLRITGTPIEHVNLDDLRGLLHLRTLALYNNQIVTFSSSSNSPVHLPNLQELALNSNRLTELSFERWNIPKLRMLLLGENRLTKVGSLLKALPALSFVTLPDNPIDCQWWQNEVAEEIAAREIYHYETNCTT